jgi:large repetitive protein
VLKVDDTTSPPGTRLGTTSNRNAEDPGSLFIDVKKGEVVQADFREPAQKGGAR